MKKCFLYITLVLMVIALVAPTVHAAFRLPGAPQAPTKAALEGALFTITINDISGLIDDVGALAAEVSPSVDSSMMKMMLGSMLGDPELSGLPAGSGLAFVMYPEGKMAVLVEVDSAKVDAYIEALKAQQTPVAKVNGLLAIAPTEENLATARKIAPQVKAMLRVPAGKAAIKANLSMANIMEQYGPMIEQQMTDMTAMMQEGGEGMPPGIGKILEGEMAVLKIVADQVDTLELNLACSAKGLTVAQVIAPKKGTPLAQLFAVPSDSTKEFANMIPGDGALRMVGNMNAEALYAFVDSTMKTLAQQTTLGDTAIAAFSSMMKDASEVYGGQFAFSMMGSDEDLMSGAMVYETKDPKKALALSLSMIERFETSGLMDLYKQMGMDMSMSVKDDTETYKGIPIHQIAMEMDMKGAPEETQAMMAQFGGFTTNMAIVNKNMVCTYGKSSINKMIDAAKARKYPGAKPLQAQTTFKPGASMYLDYDIGKLLGGIINMMKDAASETEQQEMQAFIQAMADVPPLTAAAYSEKGTAKMIIRLPVGLFKAFATMAQQGAMQQ